MKIFSDGRLYIAFAILVYTFWIYIALACTDKEVKDAICWASCKADNFDSGRYLPKTKECACEIRRKMSDAPHDPVAVPIHPDTSAYQ